MLPAGFLGNNGGQWSACGGRQSLSHDFGEGILMIISSTQHSTSIKHSEIHEPCCQPACKISQIKEAHSYVASGKACGKVVVRIQPSGTTVAN